MAVLINQQGRDWLQKALEPESIKKKEEPMRWSICFIDYPSHVMATWKLLKGELPDV